MSFDLKNVNILYKNVYGRRKQILYYINVRKNMNFENKVLKWIFYIRLLQLKRLEFWIVLRGFFFLKDWFCKRF